MAEPSSFTEARYGRARQGGGPAAKNFQLGGTANWAGDFAAGGSQAAEQQGQQAGQMKQDAYWRARESAGRDTPQTDFGAANQSIGAAGEASGAAGAAAGRQGDVYSELMGFAKGVQPSAAQAQLQKGANQSMAQSLALARSGGGFGESAAGLAQAQRANVDTMAATANDAAILRAQENQARLGAYQAAGQVAAAQGQTELQRGGLALEQAQQQAGQSQFLTQAELDAQAQRDAATQGFANQELAAFGAGVGADAAARDREFAAQQAALQGSMGFEDTKLGLYQTEVQRNMAEDQLDFEQNKFAVQAVSGAIGSAIGGAAMSDERAKQNKRLTSLRDRYRDLAA